MAFPQISDADTQSGTVTGNSTSWTLTYPTNIAAGDLLLGLISTDGDTSLTNAPTGWAIGYSTSGANTLLVIHKKADGTETGNFTLTTSANEQGAWIIYRIPANTWFGGTVRPSGARDSVGLQISTDSIAFLASTGATANPDSPSLNPNGWLTEDALWIAATSADTSRDITAYPSSPDTFTNTGKLVSGGSTGASLGYARLEKNAASVDPGTFTIAASDDWVAITIAIRRNQEFQLAQAQTYIAYFTQWIDSFNDNDSWTAADIGGVYTKTGGTWGSTATEGTFSGSTTSLQSAILNNTKGTSGEVIGRIKFDTLPSSDVILAGWKYAGNGIQGMATLFRIDSLGNLSLEIRYNNQGNTTNSGTLGTVSINTWYWLKSKIIEYSTGDFKYYIKYWQDGNSEPLTWAYSGTSTNSSYITGGFGATVSTGPGAKIISFDDINGIYTIGDYALGQAQASITAGVASSRSYAQSQADIKVTSRSYSQANADIKATSTVFAQTNADIKVTTNAYSQAQAKILVITKQYSQAQSNIKAVTWGFAQANTDIKATSRSYSQAQADIKQTYPFGTAGQQLVTDTFTGTSVIALTSHTPDTGGVSWQLFNSSFYLGWVIEPISDRIDLGATTSNNNTPIVNNLSISYGDVDLYIEVNDTQPSEGVIEAGVFGRGNDSGASPYFYYAVIDTNGQLNIGRYTNGSSTIIATTYVGFINGKLRFQIIGSSPTLLKARAWTGTEPGTWNIETSDNTASNQMTTGKTGVFGVPYDNGFDYSLNPILDNFILSTVGTVTGPTFSQAQAKVLAVGRGYAQAQARIKNTYQGYANANADIKAAVQVYSQAQASIQATTTTQVFSQAQADIKQTYRGYAQAQADIKQIYQVYSQAQADIKQTYTVYSQAQADIKQVSRGYSQAQADIKAISTVYSQANADIKATVRGYAQANADIKAVTLTYAQVNADIKTTSRGFAQAQANIKATTLVYSQAQTNIKTSYTVSANTQADIKTTYKVYSQAQANIAVTSFVFAQSQADIKTTYQQFSQAQADIKATSRGFAQAQGQIKQTYQSYAQAQACVRGNAFSQTQAQIKATYQGFAQAQGSIKATSFGWAQVNADIKATTTTYGQSQADIKTFYQGFANAQADIKQTYQGYAQAIADIKSTSTTYAQSQADIKQTYQGFGQAQADIKTAYTQFAQAQATIAASMQGYAQAQVLIYIPQYLVPIEDITTNNWVGVVI